MQKLVKFLVLVFLAQQWQKVNSDTTPQPKTIVRFLNSNHRPITLAEYRRALNRGFTPQQIENREHLRQNGVPQRAPRVPPNQQQPHLPSPPRSPQGPGSPEAPASPPRLPSPAHYHPGPDDQRIRLITGGVEFANGRRMSTSEFLRHRENGWSYNDLAK